MSRRSSQSTSGRHSAVREKPLRLLLRLAAECRSLGLRIGPSQIGEALRIYETYLALGASEKDDYSELRRIAFSVFVKRGREEPLFSEAWSRASPQRGRLLAALIERVEKNLETLGLGYGHLIKSKRALMESASRRRRAEKRRAYSELRSLGIITRTKRGERVLARDEALARLRHVAESRGSLEDALRGGLVSRLARGTPSIEPEMLAGASIPDEIMRGLRPDVLVEVGYQALKAHNKDLAFKAASMLSELVERGERVSSARRAYELLRAARMLTPRAGLMLVGHDHRLAARLLREFSPRELSRGLRAMDRASAEKALARLSRAASPAELREMLASLGADLVGSLPSSTASSLTRSEQALMATLRRYREARRALLEYLSSGQEAYLQLAWHEYLKASSTRKGIEEQELGGHMRSMLAELDQGLKGIKGILEASESGIGAGLSRAIGLLSLPETIRLLGRAYSSGDPELRREAVRLARQLMNARIARERSRVLRKWSRTRARGRLEIRPSLMETIRMSPRPLVYRRPRKGGRVVLVLDASGSMLEYSVWAMLVASAFADIVKRVVVFREHAEVIDATRLRRRDVIDVLLNTGFRGYTDIAGALEAASRGLAPSTLVLVSDLQQTTKGPPPHEIASSLIRRGWRIVALLPLKHDREEASLFREQGAHIEVIEEPSSTGRRLLRLLYW